MNVLEFMSHIRAVIYEHKQGLEKANKDLEEERSKLAVDKDGVFGFVIVLTNTL